ncbi:MAG: lipid-A-disaccharide synthase [Candidatus Eisenbacteria bacterium]|uniref:Lipid-A-disaccharide synthase n=1 Tax=Eiseniibacteriota bacterium TaxID=2212470 RepID=A0A849SMX0_UNCEI|nr:lipid-A-disaccharide synthase [Candidatus Eisenbacteria bacterium]
MVDDLTKRFLIVTGEASGDRHAARLVEAVSRIGAARWEGIAGPELRACGVAALERAEDLAVIGFSGILARLPRLFAARDRVLRAYEASRPDAVVLVDYPGFNLRLGPELKARGAKVFYYIAPQVWAWHPERAREMARWVDALAVVFPFEEAIFRNAGVRVTYVGHPLLDDLHAEVSPDELRRSLGIPDTARLLGLLPGSRRQELARHLAPLLETARELQRSRADLHAVVACAPGMRDDPALRGASGPRLHVIEGRTHAIQQAATACAVASGTATLETALFATPLVVLYRTGWLNYLLARRLVTIGRIGLPNIVAGEDVVPELVQDALTPERLMALLVPWLDDPTQRAACVQRLARVRERLGHGGAAQGAARVLWELAS